MRDLPKVQIASDEDTEKLVEAKRGAFLSELILLHRVTFKGKPKPKDVAKRRAKNKVARRQRRVNRLRSK